MKWKYGFLLKAYKKQKKYGYASPSVAYTVG